MHSWQRAVIEIMLRSHANAEMAAEDVVAHFVDL